MQRSDLARALATSSTATSFATLISTLTEPSGDGVFSFKTVIPEELMVSFFGAGADNTTFDARIVGWDKIGTTTPLWVPRILASFSCTLSAQVGVTGAALVSTDRFADTLTMNSTAPQAKFTDTDGAGAATRGTVPIFSPANDLIAWAKVPLCGVDKIQFDFDMTGATNGNAVFRYLRG